MRLKFFIVVRHGEKNRHNQHLGLQGISQINLLAKKIAKIVGDEENIKIFSSYQYRAEESADIIGKKLNVSYKSFGPLYNEECLDHFDQTLELIQDCAENTDALIFVTHQSQCRWLPYSFGENCLNTQIIEPTNVNEGCAVVVTIIENKPTLIELN